MYLSTNKKILLTLVLWRLLSIFVIQTAHVADEYWQSLEVAHRLSFGYGYLTWEWIVQIRSFLYPALISLIYKLLKVLSLDTVTTITILPKVIQAIAVAYSDYRYYTWTKNKTMLFSLCTNWYWYYCATRTLINSVETICTIIALSIFPWKDSSKESIRFFWIIGFLCMARPTALIIWIPLCAYHFFSSRHSKVSLFVRYSTIFSICFTLSVAVDSYFYGNFVITPWEFFRINFIKKIGNSYGTHPILWYLFSGLPVVLGIYYLVFFLASWQIMKQPKRFHKQLIMLFVIIWSIGIYSSISHKEFRFLLPLLPMFLYISVSQVQNLNIRITPRTRRIIIFLIIATNILPGIYFSLIHQRGSLDLMKILKNQLNSHNNTKLNLLFLTPCHATPLYSHLHVDVPVRILTCEPNLENSLDYKDESDIFFLQPTSWINRYYLDKKDIVTMPSHVIIFDTLQHRIKNFLLGYQMIAKIFYSHVPQSNYGEYLLLYENKALLKNSH